MVNTKITATGTDKLVNTAILSSNENPVVDPGNPPGGQSDTGDVTPQPASLHGVAWLDVNADGRRDGAERLIPDPSR